RSPRRSASWAGRPRCAGCSSCSASEARVTDAFTRNRSSGSGGVARGFLDALERWAALDRTSEPAALRTGLLRWLREAQAAQPSMALVHELAARALAVADTAVARGDRAADLRAHLAASCTAERQDLERAVADAAKTAAQLISASEPWIATLSASGGVRAALLA